MNSESQRWACLTRTQVPLWKTIASSQITEGRIQ